jgi:hypothetical protein
MGQVGGTYSLILNVLLTQENFHGWCSQMLKDEYNSIKYFPYSP